MQGQGQAYKSRFLPEQPYYSSVFPMTMLAVQPKGSSQHTENFKSRQQRIQSLKSRLREWGHSDDDDSSSSGDSDSVHQGDAEEDSKDMDESSRQRISELKARLREWEECLKIKSEALSTSGHQKVVKSIFKEDQNRRREFQHDDEDEVIIEYDVPIGKPEDASTRTSATRRTGVRSRHSKGTGNNSSSEKKRNNDPNSSGFPEFDHAQAFIELGEGPMRYAPNDDGDSFQEHVALLDSEDRECYTNLVKRWHYQYMRHLSSGSGSAGGNSRKNGNNFPLSNPWILRFAIYHNFNEKRAWKAMRKLKSRFIYLNAFDLESQLLTKTLFPVPGLRTLDGGHPMFYMKPSRYFPKHTTTKVIINNLSYVMNAILEQNYESQSKGIGFIANMNDWAMQNFAVDYCFQYMMCLQGFCVPVKVELFLIVNPPSWFGTIWKIMKPMLAPSFRRKVKVILADKLPKYLEAGYEAYLPDDMDEGQANTDVLVDDFIKYRKYYEQHVNDIGCEQNKRSKEDDALSDIDEVSHGHSVSSSSGGISLDDTSTCSFENMVLLGDDDNNTFDAGTRNGDSSSGGGVHSQDLWMKQATEKFTPKIAMQKSKESLLGASVFDETYDPNETTGWEGDYLKQVSENGKASDDDASIDSQLSFLDDTGW